MNSLRGYSRLIAFLGLTTYHMLRVGILKLLKPQKLDVFIPEMKKWALRTQNTLGIEVEVSGFSGQEKALLVPNHRSYIDIILFPPYFNPVFVAKAEVKKWPIIGKAADLAQTVWVNRESKASRKQTRDLIARRIQDGFCVVVFPEGTTSKAPMMKEFRPGMFYRAAEAGIPVVPVALEYEDPADAWVGDDSFIPHFIQCFGKKKTRITLNIGPALKGDKGVELKDQAENWVRTQLAVQQKSLGITETLENF